MEEEELIRIRWHVDRTKEPCEFMLVCDHPDYPELTLSVSSEKMTERVAKAWLMEHMYRLGREKGIPLRRLRFKINGIKE